MASERVQRRVERLLDEIEAAADARDWARVQALAEDILRLDPENADGRAFLAAAQRDTAVAAPSPPSTASPPAAPPQPTSFASGRYEVRRFLGEGGKKRVYLAHDAQLDRDVAFALIKTEGLDEAARTRVTREAQAMGRLGSHPHIVTVYDIGEEGGQPYLVLPVLPGGDVEGVIEKAEGHKLPIEQAIRIGIETCLGLEFSHAKGIIHRDLKPGNVWLAEDGRAMIGDFGLAVAVDRSRLTQAGMMVGTVNYMPPEQAMGGEVTPRSDLYSLGAMLYEMVCGRPPFVGDESVAIIGQHLNTPPVAPSWHRPDCPSGLEALVLRLLEKDPQKRPASATEVREALEAIDPYTTALPARARGENAPAPSQGKGEAEGARAPAAPDPLYRRTFVGRENETRQLHQAYDAAVSGQGGLVMVVGEPGIGKTALCEQLATYVQLRGGRTLVGHCYEEGSLSLPYLAFVEAMRSYVLAREPEALRSELGTGAAEVARIVSEVRDRVQVELRDASDPEDDRWRLLNAVSAFLRNAASVQPLVIVLEDLHWADRGTLDLLLHVARNLEGPSTGSGRSARLLIVGTYRDVEVDRTHPLSATLADLRRINTFLRVPLRGLMVDEVHRMYEALRGNEVPAAQAEAVFRATEGNPLFVQEVLRYLVEEGIVVRQEGRYVGTGLGVGIPEGLRDVVGRRLGHLSQRSNEVLSIASVIGRDFSLEVLQRVSNLPEEDLVSALEEASERSIIEQREVAGGIGFRFTHAFFRQVLYEEIFAPRRIRWHQQVGRALEEVHARRIEDHASELAEHFSQSTEAEDLAKAVRYGELAARRAMSVFDHGETVRHLEQALKAQEILDADDALKRCDLLLALVYPLSMVGEPVRAAQEVAEEAFQIADRLGDRARALLAFRLADQAISRHSRAWPFTGREVWTERGDRLAFPGTVDRVYADVALGFTVDQFSGGMSDFSDRAWHYRERAFNLARTLGDNAALYRSGLFAIIQPRRLAEWREALPLAEEALTWPREGVPSAQVGEVLWHCSNIFYQQGLMDRCDAVQQDMDNLGQRARDTDLTKFVLFMRSRRSFHDGRLQEALDTAIELRELGRETGAPWFFSLGTLMEVRPRLLLGSDVEGMLERLPDSLPGTSARIVQATICAHLGNLEDALHHLDGLGEQVLPDFIRIEASTGDLAIALDALAILGAPDPAASIVKTIEPMAPALNRFVTFCTGRVLGDAAARLSDPAAARRYYDIAIDSCTRSAFRPELALSRLGLAEVLLDHHPDEHDAAIEHLDLAIAELRDMKMQPALERALGRRGLLKA